MEDPNTQPGSEIVILITTSSEEEADKIAQSLIDDGLAACANILPRVKSIFRWQGKVSQEYESMMILKSKAELFEKLTEKVKRLHSYEVPEIIACPIVKGLRAYLDWISRETRK